MQVQRLRFDDRADFELWQDYVQARPDSHCSDLAEWRLLFRDLYGIEDHSYVCRAGGRTLGGLSLSHVRSPFMGRMLVTPPFFGYGGFYWETEAARDALLQQAYSAARKLRVDYVELRLREQLPPPYRANSDFAEFNLELGATTEETWKHRLRPNARQNVRKSQSHELEFRLSADYDSCYDLLRQTLRAHGTPFHGERFFELLAVHLGDRVRYSEIWHGRRIVAGGVVIRFKDTIITPYIGSLAESRQLRANYRQYWELIVHGLEGQVRRFEMGRSPRLSTHARFKTKWGCDEMPLFYNYLVVNPRKRYRSVSRPSPIQRLATRIWRRLPPRLTSTMGPWFSRYIP